MDIDIGIKKKINKETCCADIASRTAALSRLLAQNFRTFSKLLT